MAKVGLQLYSVKDKCEENFIETLRTVAEMGYDGVEFAGYYDIEPKKIKNELNKNKLEAAGTHIVVEELESNINSEIEKAKIIGSQAIICPGLFGSYVSSEKSFIYAAELFNKIGKKCKENNIKFMYHIHGYEFNDFGGKSGMVILSENTDPKFVYFELDTFWLKWAGINPLDFYLKYAKRCTSLHFKDMDSQGKDIEVGEGVLEFNKIIDQTKSYQVDWIVVEQEEFNRDSFESVCISLTNIKKMIENT